MPINVVLGKIQALNKRYQAEVHRYLEIAEEIEMTITSVERITKKNKSIDDLLFWNGMVT